MSATTNRSILWTVTAGSALLVGFMALFCQISSAQAERFLDYLPWGVDEYELFGLTASEVEKRIAGKAVVSNSGQEISFDDPIASSTARFHVKYDHGKVCSVQRQFTGRFAGYTAIGPTLVSKEAALEYVIKTMSAKQPLDTKSTLHLLQARKILADLRRKQTKETTKVSGARP